MSQASTGPYAAHGGGDPEARIYRRQAGEPWRALSGGLPDPLPAMPYALVAGDGRLFAALADGQIWQSSDRGDSWRACTSHGAPPPAIHALVYTSTEAENPPPSVGRELEPKLTRIANDNVSA